MDFFERVSRFGYVPIDEMEVNEGLGGALESTSRITALEFLPLSTDHASNPLVSSDRVILLMGDIQLPGFGNASAVLFDGSQYQPYILTTKSDGSNGLITTLFSQQTQSFTSNGNPSQFES